MLYLEPKNLSDNPFSKNAANIVLAQITEGPPPEIIDIAEALAKTLIGWWRYRHYLIPHTSSSPTASLQGCNGSQAPSFMRFTRSTPLAMV
jgi:hypothetical protein